MPFTPAPRLGFSVEIPPSASRLEVLMALLDVLRREYGAMVEDVTVGTRDVVAEVVLPRPRPAA